MKIIITLFLASACLLLILDGSVKGQWANNPPHIHTTNVGGNVGIGFNAVPWAPSEKLHIDAGINNQGANAPRILVESNWGGNAGNIAIASLKLKNSGSGDFYQVVFRKNNLSHQMVQSCWDNTALAWREFNFFDFNTRKYEMRNGILDCEFKNTGKFLVSSGGFTGIGTLNPLEKLDINGAVRIGNTANNNAGTIRWDGANFLGFNGAGWVNLDYQPAGPVTWLVIPNPVAPNNPQLYPGTPPASVTNALPGMPNFGGWFHAVDAPAPGMYPHQLMLESITGLGGALGASQLFRISNGFSPPFVDFSLGIFSGDGTFKLTNVPNLFPTIYSDNISMLRVFPTGIVDLPNQSRVRAYQQDPAGFIQSVPSGIWTPVNYNFDAPLPIGYDEQNEFIVAPVANVPVPPEMAFFVAAKEGYYQVNARCQFEVYYIQNPGAYVSIAIWTGPGPGATVPYAQGNNLQIMTFGPVGEPVPLEWNNAPNVSDVVYLMQGQIISIWVFQNSGAALNLIQGHDKCYVSIHKVS